MSLVLAKSLRLVDPDLRAPMRAPLGLTFQVLIHSMLSEQPLALAGVTGEHLPLGLEDSRDIHVKVDRDGLSLAVRSFERIHEVKMRNSLERRGGIPLARGVVRARRPETGVAHQQAGHLVVAEIVDRRRGQDDVRPGSAEGLGDLSPRVVIVEDRQVAKLEAEVLGPDQRGRGSGLAAADLGDRRAIVLGTAAVARSHRRDRHLAPRLAQQGQRPRALELDIVRMSMNGQNPRCRGHGNLTPGGGQARFVCSVVYWLEGRDSSPHFPLQDATMLSLKHPHSRHQSSSTR